MSAFHPLRTLAAVRTRLSSELVQRFKMREPPELREPPGPPELLGRPELQAQLEPQVRRRQQAVGSPRSQAAKTRSRALRR